MRRVLKNIGGGIGVGIANIIPGVSGGTMLVILGLFDQLMESISEIVKIKSEKRWQAIWFVMQVVLGAGIGLVGFAKIVDILFVNYSTQTFYWFVGLILLSIPTLVKQELKGNKISWPLLIIGALVIFAINFFSPDKQELAVEIFPSLSVGYIAMLVIVGMISGATMLFPGVSGSMILLIIGQYYLFKSLVANVTTFESDVLISLVFIAIGAGLGVLISAKLTHYLLKNHRGKTVSLIVGLIIASAIVLIPFSASYDGMTIVTSAVSFAIGGLVVVGIEKLA